MRKILELVEDANIPNTGERVDAEEVLTKAWAAVEASGVPKELYELAFKEAVGLLSKTVMAQPVSRAEYLVPKQGSSSEQGLADNQPADQSPSVQHFANESGIPVGELEEVFYFDPDGTPHLNVAGRKLGESTASKAKAVATALAAAYHFSHDDPQVAVDVIKSECERLKCYDKKNFWAHMGASPATVLSGAGSTRVLKVKSSEIAAALRTVVNSARGTKE